MIWVGNIIVAALVAGGVYVWLRARRNRLWREALRALVRRRRIALIVLAIYVVIGMLDTVSWVGGGGVQGVAASEARSVIDRLFKPSIFREKSYSAPFAQVEFVGGAALTFPGRHVLGTDILGDDVLYKTLKGVKVALLIGGLTCLVLIPLALLFGVSAGYFGGRIDDIVFFTMSTLASIPNLLLLIALIMALGKGTLQVCFALGVTGWVGLSRLTRAETLKLRELDYVQAARALGVSHATIVMRHVLPNLAHLVIITFALLFTGLVLSETILAYLGIGLDGSWGRMIDQSRNELSRDPIIWWNIIAASSALFILVLCVNLIADALRDILDPRTLRDRA
jgi:peptide/nickel transport system permease protein